MTIDGLNTKTGKKENIRLLFIHTTLSSHYSLMKSSNCCKTSPSGSSLLPPSWLVSRARRLLTSDMSSEPEIIIIYL